jgi:excisionase family DNA binding protein
VADAAEAAAVLAYVGRLLTEARRRARANGGSWPLVLESAWALASGRQEPPEVEPGAALREPLLVTYAEAGRLLSVSERSVERLVARGELPVVEVGGSRRIQPGDLVEFAESSARRVPGEKPRREVGSSGAGRRPSTKKVGDGGTSAA